MSRRRRTLLVVLALVLLAAGGFAWYWQATAVDRQVNALLAKVRRTGRGGADVSADLAALGPSAVPALIRALRDSDLRVRCVAAWALGELGDRRAVEPLIAALKDEWEVVRRIAAEVLGKLGDARAVEPLKELLGDEQDFVRAAAAEALKRLRGKSEGKP